MGNSDKGSLTVEASIVIPFFICIIFLFAFLIKVFATYEIMQHAVSEAASEISTYSYIYWVSGVGKKDRTLEDNLERGSEAARNDFRVFSEAYTSLRGLPAYLQERILNGQASLTNGELDSAYQEAIEVREDLGEMMESFRDAYTTGKKIFENPMEEVKSILCIVGTGAYGDMKAFLSENLTGWLVKKHLTNDRFSDPGRRVKSLGVVNGLEGLDFSSTRIFDNGQQDIDIIVRYKIRSGLPFGILSELNMVNRVVTRGWLEGDGSGNTRMNNPTGESVWDLSNFERNKRIRKAFKTNLPLSFPGLANFDRSTGRATDLRSMDLRKPSYIDPEVVKVEIFKEIAALSAFNGGRTGNIVIMPGEIKSKGYILVVPKGSLTERMAKVVEACRQEAVRRGMEFRLEELE